MLFDQLVQITENRLVPFAEELKALLKDAELYYFPGIPHVHLPKHQPVEFVKHFRFTEPVVAVEDPGSLVLLWSNNNGQRPVVEGELHFLECMPSVPLPTAFRDGGPVSDESGHIDGAWKDVLLLAGTFELLPDIEQYGAGKSGYVIQSKVAVCGELRCGTFLDITRMLHTDADSPIGSITKNAVTALEELFVFKQRSEMIITQLPRQAARADKQGAILTSSERIVRTFPATLFNLDRYTH